ncbi:MAG TPA: uracil-DNA glycosylase [Dehalococcoidia bacterium]|nr:uracil-DNA glycosylase [Dehalococcoidia bacterium]
MTAAFDPEAFVARLAAVSLPDTFNPYRDVCPIHDSPDSPAVRRANQTAWLAAQLRLRPDGLWVGEAGGYRGLRRTGLLLTSEEWLDTASARLGVHFRKATVTPIAKELSAGAVWREIERLGRVPLIWAAVPLHAHRPGQPLTNRNPTVSEVRTFHALLEELLAAFRPRTVIAIGRIAERALTEVGVPCTYVRHPSMAGIPQFREGIRGIYGGGQAT